MSFTTRDVRCTAHPDEHYQISVLFKVSEGPPACPTCGEPQTTFWATLEQQGLAPLERTETITGDRRVKYDGKWITRDEMNKIVSDHAARQGVPRESFEIRGLDNLGQRTDERHHRAIQNRRAAGYDEHQFRDYQREQRRHH